MREDYGTLPMSINDDGFGDMGFDADTPDLMRDGLEHNLEVNINSKWSECIIFLVIFSV